MNSRFFIPAIFIFSLTLFAIPNDSLAVNIPPVQEESKSVLDCTSTLFAPLQLSDVRNLSRKKIEKKLDRKLKLKERLSLKMLKRYVKRADRLGLDNEDCEQMEKKAKGGLVMGIIGLFIAGLILGILAIIFGSKARKYAKENPDCEKAAASKTKGTIAIVLGVLDIIGGALVIAFLL